MTSIHWFRRDLRLSDNPALNEAAARSPGTRSTPPHVVGLFVVDPALWSASGSRRRAYLLASLRALDTQLDGRLVVRTGDPAVVLPEVARHADAAHVTVTGSYEPYGRRRDEAVARALAAMGVAMHATGSPYAVSPGRIRTRSGTPYQVFTPFRSAWLDHGWPLPADRVDDIEWCQLESETLPGTPDPSITAGEQATMQRWHAFADAIENYHRDRDRPDLDATSRISTSLKWGEVHPRTLLADLRAVPGQGATALRSELAWREFHADVLYHRPGAATRSIRPALPPDSWTPAPHRDIWFEAWTQGRTGYPLVDAGMRQLAAEGWVHGRVRMVVGSFLVKDLHIPWQRGAKHFMTHLHDADRAQNQLNWQWVAGTGLDAAPYFRIFNPVTQGITFDPEGQYVRRWVPELRGIPGRAVHEPWKLAQQPSCYPPRIVDHAIERDRTLADYARNRR